MRYRLDGLQSHFAVKATSSVHDTSARGARLAGEIMVPDGQLASLPHATAQATVDMGELVCGDRLATAAMRRHFALDRDAIATVTVEPQGLTAPAGTEAAFTSGLRASLLFRGRRAPWAAAVAGTLSPTSLSLRVTGTFDLTLLGLSPPRMLWMRVDPVIGLEVVLVASALPAL